MKNICTKLNKICAYCGLEYFITNKKYSKKQIKNSKFCSRECQYKGKNTFIRPVLKKINMECLVCKIIFSKYPSSRKCNTVHCSSKCAGVTNGNKLKNKKLKTETLEKIKNTKIKNGTFYLSKERIEKLVKSRSGRNVSGEKNPNWRGGYDLKNAIRKTKVYKEWRTAVFKMDNYTCVLCGIRFIKGVTGKVILEADHIKPFAHYPELRLDINNGRTLCKQCHIKTDTYGGKLKKYEV